MKVRDERNSIRKNALTLFGGGMGASVFAGIEVVLLARFLGLEQFGLFALVLSYVGIVNTVVDFKIGEASVKYVAESKEKGDRESAASFVKLFYIVDFFSGALAFAVCMALAGAANELFLKSGDSFQYVVILSLSLLFSTVNQNSYAILEGLKRFGESASFKTLHAFIRLALIVAAFASGFGLKGFFAAYVVSSAVNCALLQFFVNRTLVREGMGGWLFADLARIRGKMREVFWFIFNTASFGFLSFSFSAHVPVILLGYFSGAEASGLYKVARSVVKILEKITGPVSAAIYPALVRTASRGAHKEFRQVIIYSLREALKLLLPVCIVLFVFADFAINFVYGADYIPAAGAMRVMTAAGFAVSSMYWLSPALLSLGMPGVRTLILAGMACAQMAAFVLLIPGYSYVGAAYASLIYGAGGFAAAVFVFARIARKKMPEGKTT